MFFLLYVSDWEHIITYESDFIFKNGLDVVDEI